MKFGNRFVNNERLNAHRNARYFSHLALSGFTRRDKVYVAFAGDVFHDGPVDLVDVRLQKGEVSMSMRNVHTVNMLTNEYGLKLSEDVLDRVSKTIVKCVGVVEFRFSAHSASHRNMLYKYSELSTTKDKYCVDILCVDGKTGKPISIRVVCSSVDIGDITPRVRKVIGKRRFRPGTVSPILHDPTYYTQWYKSLADKG